ncbi:MAG: hypothetical protein LBL70_08010, partial [Treponema sp.]|nr:hypothetical protein [Treponema sp.]
MDINAYTVCDETGRTDLKKGSFATPDKGYTLYIQLKEPEKVEAKGDKTAKDVYDAIVPGENEKTYTKGNGESMTYWLVECAEVKFAMPLGGPIEGFFRFPRVGEKVLAGRLGDTLWNSEKKGLEFPSGDYVLMGFMPTSEAPFYPQNALGNMTLDKAKTDLGTAQNALKTLEKGTDGYIDQEKKIAELEQYIREGDPSRKNPGDMGDFLTDNGMALRYKQEDNLNPAVKGIQTNVGKGAYSEIAFYNKQAKWPELDDKGDITGYKRQDTINIQSTGDIESRAENYHLLKAKRFEILVGENAKEISPETRIDNGNSNNWKAGSAPLGDNV